MGTSIVVTQSVLFAVLSLAVAVITAAARAYLASHQKQVDAVVGQIADQDVRALAAQAVRAAEVTPAVALAPGSAQRAWAIAALTAAGVSAPAASLGVDAAYHGLKMSGQLGARADPQPAPSAALPPSAPPG